jgi:hypothetical protein
MAVMKPGIVTGMIALTLWGLSFPPRSCASTQAQIVVPDRLCLPGEEVFIEATLCRTGLLGRLHPGVQGELLEFFDAQGTLLASRLTDPTGQARLPHRAAGLGCFPVEVRLADNPRFRADPALGTVFIRDRTRPFFFATVEQGLFEQGPLGPWGPAVQEGQPLSDSAESLKRIATCSTLVYLTGRPKIRLNEVRRRLAGHAFPPAPILLLQTTVDPETPLAPTLTTDLFESLGEGKAAPGFLATGNRGLASLAADHRLEVYLLGSEEETGPAREEENRNPRIRAVTGWREVPSPCGHP